MANFILPREVLHHILSFLQDDAHSLQRCACVSELFCAIAERHIYNKIVLHNAGYSSCSGYFSTTGPQLSKILATTPHITKYVKSVQVTIMAPSLLQWIMARSVNDGEIAPVLAKLTYIEHFSLTGRNERDIAFNGLHIHLQNSIFNVFRSCTLTEIILDGVLHFPLSALNDCSALKKLSLIRCTFTSSDEPIIDCEVRPRLDSLTIRVSSHSSSTMEQLLVAAHIYFDITSLQLLSVEVSHALDYASLVQMLALCSRSLHVLEIKSGSEVNTSYDPYRGSVTMEPVASAPPIPLDLTDMRCLQSLCLTGRLWSAADFWISSTGEESLERVTYSTPFPWLAQTFEKMPASLTRVVIHLLFYVDFSALKRIDWSLLVNALLPIAHLRPINLFVSFWGMKSNFSIDYAIRSLKEERLIAELIRKGVLNISIAKTGRGAHL